MARHLQSLEALGRLRKDNSRLCCMNSVGAVWLSPVRLSGDREDLEQLVASDRNGSLTGRGVSCHDDGRLLSSVDANGR